MAQIRSSNATFPSIQSFFSSTSSPTKPKSNIIGDDGFTPDEVSSRHEFYQKSWVPEFSYIEHTIGSIVPGSQHIMFQGRVANLYDNVTPSKLPQAARGCFKIIVKDDTGALTVKLWYGNERYYLRLGQFVRVWTSHVTDGSVLYSSTVAPLVVSIFPRRDRHCNFVIVQEEREGHCRKPLGYKEGDSLPGLMTLDNFIKEGFEVSGSKILICVKSIGAKKMVCNKEGKAHTLVDVGIFDNTAATSLTLWDAAVPSVDAWIPSSTVLLITGAEVRNGRITSLSLSSNTFVDIDPKVKDAAWLRNMAQKLTKRTHVNPVCPTIFDLESALSSPLRVLYTLADIDEFVRAAPNETFIGFISVIILDMHIGALHMRNMLLCNECCGVPIFANSIKAICKHCEKVVTLRLNPRIVGTVIDETGALGHGKLNWTDQAWDQLLGRHAEALVSESGNLRRALEKRIVFARISLIFGWTNEEISGGRLCILGVYS